MTNPHTWTQHSFTVTCIHDRGSLSPPTPTPPRHHRPSATHTQPQTSSPAARFSTQAFRCFRYSFSDICLVLYKDMPIPTVAIVMAMESTLLLCGCICTSPETCLYGENAFKAFNATYPAWFRRDYVIST